MNKPIACFVNGGFVLEFGGCIMSFLGRFGRHLGIDLFVHAHLFE